MRNQLLCYKRRWSLGGGELCGAVTTQIPLDDRHCGSDVVSTRQKSAYRSSAKLDLQWGQA